MSVFRITVVVAALAVAAVTPAAAEVVPQAEGTGFALVAGRGTAVNPNVPGVRYQVEVFVVRGANGAVWGFYRHGGPGGFLVEARCVRTEAGRALIGGIIVSSPSVPGQVGMGASLVVDDRGEFGRPLDDRLISGVGPPTSTPCPFSPARVAGPWDDVVSGDFTVFTSPFGG
jgi:hypothetical protein